MEKNSEAPRKVSSDEQATGIVPARWDYRKLMLAFAISLFLQASFLPCICREGVFKTNFAMMFDGYVLVRILLSLLLKERGGTWRFYAGLLYTSPVWITVLFVWLACL